MRTFFYLPKRILLGLLLLTAFSSCLSDKLDLPSPGTDETDVVFSIKLERNSVPTKALGSTHENDVKSIQVLVFDGTGKYLYPAPVRNLQDHATDITKKTFTVTLRTGTFDLMVLANAGDILSGAYTDGEIPTDGSITKTVLEQALTLTAASGWNADPLDAGYKPVPMWGTLKETEITEQTTAKSVNLIRMVAKIDVALKNTITEGTFKLTSVRFHNYNSVGRLIPDDAPTWTSAAPAATAPSLPSLPARIEGPQVFTTMTTDNRALEGMIYTFEATKGIASGNTGYMQNPCLVIGGKYGGSDTETFYRVDFAKQSGNTVTYLDLLRNYNYTVTIQNVSGPGLPDPDDAFNSLPINITADVVEWTNGNIPEIVFDGQHMLGVNKSYFELTRDPRTGLGSDNKLTVTTDVPTGWKAELFADEAGTLPVGDDPATSAPWLSLSALSGNGNYPAGNDVALLMPANNTGNSRTAYVHLTAGRLKLVVTVTQTMNSEVWINVLSDRDVTLCSGIESTIANEPVVLEWFPSASAVEVTVTPMLNTGVLLQGLATGSNLPGGTGSYNNTITADPMSAVEIGIDRYRERTSLVTFKVTNEWGESATTSIVVRQQHYSLQVERISDVYDNVYQMLPVKRVAYGYNQLTEDITAGRGFNQQRVNVTCNTRWKATITYHDGKGGSIQEIVNSTGYGNTAGEDCWFRMKEDGSDDKWEAVSNLTFTSPDGLFDPVEIDIWGYWGYVFTANDKGGSDKNSLWIARPDDLVINNQETFKRGDARDNCINRGWVLPFLTPLRAFRHDVFDIAGGVVPEEKKYLFPVYGLKEKRYWSLTGSPGVYYSLEYENGDEKSGIAGSDYRVRCVKKLRDNI